MIRKYILGSDNSPQLYTQELTVPAGAYYDLVLTTGPISWAIVTQRNILAGESGLAHFGPYYMAGSGAAVATYVISSFADANAESPGDTGHPSEFFSGGLIVSLNGQVLQNGVDYVENVGLDGFDFQSARFPDGSGGTEYPTADDELMILYSGSASTSVTSGVGTVELLNAVTPGDTTVTVRFTGLAGQTLGVDVLCQ